MSPARMVQLEISVVSWLLTNAEIQVEAQKGVNLISLTFRSRCTEGDAISPDKPLPEKGAYSVPKKISRQFVCMKF